MYIAIDKIPPMIILELLMVAVCLKRQKHEVTMKFKLMFGSLLILLFSSIAYAQKITHEAFRNAEWEMKKLLWQQQQKEFDSDLLLDQSDYDVKYWELDVNVTNIEGQIISGKVTMTSESRIDGLTAIDYNFHSVMVTDSVFMNGHAVSFTRPSNLLHITLDGAYDTGEQFTTIVYYHGHPPGGGFGSFTWDTHNGQPIISTLSEPEGAREWWPCKDMPHDKADSADVIMTIPSNLMGTSNGIIASNNDNGNGTRTIHWHISYPITTYLISLAISNYQSFTDWYVTDQGDSMPVTNYVYPEHFAQAEEDLSVTPQAIGIYADLFGEYPFLREKYGHSIFPWGGAMEHQNNTSYGAPLITGYHWYDWIVAHELGHMWFGDMITCDIWPDIWMNEGFASYLEALWTEALSGHDAYLNYMRNNNGVSDPSGPIYDPNPLFDPNTVYSKGSWVLHMLRGVMGDDAFFQGMYSYANHPDHQYGTITTRQFQHLMEEFYGAPLDWFFDECVWGRNRPTYMYSWLSESIGNGQYEIFMHIRQTQSSPAPSVFIMPIKIYPRVNGVDTLITIWNDSRIDDIRFIINGSPTMMRFDIDEWILRYVSSENYTMNIVTTELPDGNIDQGYSEVIESRGGNTPYSYAVLSGQLPPGLTLNGGTGEVSGTPNTEGSFTFTIRCTDSSNPAKTDDQEYTVVIGTGTGIPGEETQTPSNFALIGNYPNPFNNSTVIKFRLADPADVTLEIFNVLGQRMLTLYSGNMSAGEHELVWNGENASSGVYFYRPTAGEKTAIKKMALVK